MRSLIENGNLYIARPPLFKIKRGKEELYLSDENALQESLIKYGTKGFLFKTALKNEFSGKDLTNMLVKVGEIIDLFNKIPDRYDPKVLEQIAIAGCLDTEKFLDSKEKSKEASNYVAQRINISRPDFDRGWNCLLYTSDAADE